MASAAHTWWKALTGGTAAVPRMTTTTATPMVAPGPGLAAIPPKTDSVSAVLNAPHRLLQPIR